MYVPTLIESLLQLPFRHKSILGDAYGLISSPNGIVSQSHPAQAETILFDCVVVMGVTTPLDNILSNLYMYLDAYGRRSYFLYIFSSPEHFPQCFAVPLLNFTER